MKMTKEEQNYYLQAVKDHWVNIRLQIERGLYTLETLEAVFIVLIFIYYVYSPFLD